MFVTKIPKVSMARNSAVIRYRFVTKIKDVPVGKGIQKGDENGIISSLTGLS